MFIVKFIKERQGTPRFSKKICVPLFLSSQVIRLYNKLMFVEDPLDLNDHQGRNVLYCS